MIKGFPARESNPCRREFYHCQCVVRLWGSKATSTGLSLSSAKKFKPLEVLVKKISCKNKKYGKRDQFYWNEELKCQDENLKHVKNSLKTTSVNCCQKPVKK